MEVYNYPKYIFVAISSVEREYIKEYIMHLIIKIVSLKTHKAKDKRLRKTSFAKIYIVNIN